MTFDIENNMASGNGSNSDVLAKSVTAGDYSDGPRGGVFHFMLPSMGGTSPDLAPYWSYGRDWTLYSTIYRESMWAAAIYIAVTKQASKSFDIGSDIPKRQADGQRLFLSFDNNRGWVGGISKHLQAYLLTGNGGPIEIVRATGAPGSKILGLIPLDPFRTVRTGDAQVPFLYSDRRGALHEMKAHEAFIIADQPDMMDLWYGVGHCAAERAYQAIIKMESIERYIYEKVSGKRALALDFIAGVLPAQIEDAKRTAQAESISKGVTTYMGSTIIALAGDTPPVHVRVNLAELPDGFQRKEEFDISLLSYARSIGIPVQDLQPLSGQGLGTGTQSQVLEESAKGQGLATWNKAFGHAVNEFALDESTTFYFKENDIRDREREANLRIAEMTAIAGWVAMQAITIEQARQLGVDRDQLPREFIPKDVTEGGSLTDTEKPVDESEVTPADTETPVLTETPPAPIAEPILKTAREIYNALRSGNAGEARPDYAPAHDERLDRAMKSQERLVEAIVSQAKVQRDTSSLPDLSESVRQSVDMAYRQMNENEGKIDGKFTELEAGIKALHAQIEKSVETSASTYDVSALRDTLAQLTQAQQAREREAGQRREKELRELRASMKELKEKENTVTVHTDYAVIEKAVNDAVALTQVSEKHAGDLVTNARIIEWDSDGFASKARKTLADGRTFEYRAIRQNGRLVEWEEITT